jgi:hypothetical protein
MMLVRLRLKDDSTTSNETLSKAKTQITRKG